MTDEHLVRYTHPQLMSLARRHNIAALCGARLYRRAKGRVVPGYSFTWVLTNSPDEFLYNGDGGDGVHRKHSIRYWLMQENTAVLGKLGDNPIGLSLIEFMSELVKMRPASHMQAVSTLQYAGEHRFELFDGKLEDLVVAAKKYVR